MGFVPNQQSYALSGFVARLREIDTLLGCAIREPTGPTQTRKSNRVNNAVCRSAMVLLCAHMEGFYEDLVEAFLDSCMAAPVKSRQLPFEVRTAQLWRHIKGDSSTIERKWRSLNDVLDSAVGQDDVDCTAGSLVVEAHKSGFANPGSNEVDGLMRSIGIRDFWKLVEAKAPGEQLKSVLDAVVCQRLPIAHGVPTATSTPEDVFRYRVRMARLAKVSDGIASAHLAAVTGAPDSWI